MGALTEREHIACDIFCARLSAHCESGEEFVKDLSRIAVRDADLLIAELDRTAAIKSAQEAKKKNPNKK